MKKNRIIWAILLIISLVGISWFGGPVSYGFFAVLILIPIMSLLYLLLVAIFFRIYQDLPGKQLTACQTYPFTFRLMNEFPFAFAGIRVGFFSSFSTISGLSDDEEYELLPKTGVQAPIMDHTVSPFAYSMLSQNRLRRLPPVPGIGCPR